MSILLTSIFFTLSTHKYRSWFEFPRGVVYISTHMPCGFVYFWVFIYDVKVPMPFLGICLRYSLTKLLPMFFDAHWTSTMSFGVCVCVRTCVSACVCVCVCVCGGGLKNVLPHYLTGLRWFQMHRLSRAMEEPNHRQPTNQPEVHARTQLVKTPCHQLREVPCQPEVHAVTNPVHMYRLPAAKHLTSQRSVQWPGLLNYYSVPITITSHM